ncbi:slc25a42 [Symbiodinium microadriaticum]|nr:slc25a42 [Symbiodinium microadriaticum]
MRHPSILCPVHPPLIKRLLIYRASSNTFQDLDTYSKSESQNLKLQAGLSFMAYETLKAQVANEGEVELRPHVRLLCGACAGIFAQSTTYPLDIVRRRMQVHPELYKSCPALPRQNPMNSQKVDRRIEKICLIPWKLSEIWFLKGAGGSKGQSRTTIFELLYSWSEYRLPKLQGPLRGKAGGPYAAMELQRLALLGSLGAAYLNGTILGWDCDSPIFDEIWETASRVLDHTLKASDNVNHLRWTSHASQDRCPIAVAVSRIVHCILTFQRDWHGDIPKLLARPIHMLHIPFSWELQLLLQPKLLLPETPTSRKWHLLFLEGLGQLSDMLCLGDVKPNYTQYCQENPWTEGCDRHLPSCNGQARWPASTEQLYQCGLLKGARGWQCIHRRLPTANSLLELLVPSQSSWWYALKHALARHIWRGTRGQKAKPLSSCSKALPKQYLPAALCPAGSNLAPLDGYVAQTEVIPGRLEAVIFAATVQELKGCGVEVELHLQVTELQAPVRLAPCEVIACREQCATWEASHYLRFACHVSLNDTDVEYKALGATGSGHITEPTLHTVIRCRFPYAVLPEWLGGSWNRTGWNLELHELDGVFHTPIPLQMCPYSRPEPGERNIALCLRPTIDAGKIKQLTADWLAYHRMMGADHVFIPDMDGSVESLLMEDMPAGRLLRQGRLTYVKDVHKRFGRRVAGLNGVIWSSFSAPVCVESLAANHCLALARSAGFEWFVFLRGLDKFLHSDLDMQPGMLRRFLNRAPPAFQILRRHCGGRDREALQQGTDVNVSSVPPVFSQFRLCEPLQLSVEDPMRDVSWVPAMRTSATDLILPNMPVIFNRSYAGSVPGIPVHILRAQHYVRAFEESGEREERKHSKELDEDSRFTELEHGMEWAVVEVSYGKARRYIIYLFFSPPRPIAGRRPNLKHEPCKCYATPHPEGRRVTSSHPIKYTHP